MTEEFDEDVVFENSPLFHYLHDLGHTDFEACPTVSQEEEDQTSHHDAPPKTSGGRLRRLADALWRWIPIHQTAPSPKLEQQLDSVFGQYSVRCILDQDVLLQEDVELIELLDPSLLTLGSSPSGSPSRPSALPRPSLLANPSLWDMAGLVGLAAVLLGLCSASEGLCSLAAAPWGIAVLGWVGLRGVGLWRQGRMQRTVHTRATEIQTLVQNSKALTGLSRKALRLVQETEVISRGFTLVSAASSFSRAGPGSVPRGQQLIGLRKALYRALRSAFRASRRATCHMLKAFPLNSEIDNVYNYVSAVPLKELGLGLGVEHLGDEQAQELTDDYSLPALKVLFQLWVGQSSECFRRLALLLSPHRLEESVEGAANGEAPLQSVLYSSIAAVTEPLHHALGSCLSEVQRSYDFHRYFETQPRAQGSDRLGGARDKCRELNTLHTSIRSLQLHLKALLSEMIILEDDLEKLMVSKQPVELTCEGYLELSNRLHHLQPHMQASTSCWDDSMGQVDRMLKRASSCPDTTPHLSSQSVRCFHGYSEVIFSTDFLLPALRLFPVMEEVAPSEYIGQETDERGTAEEHCAAPMANVPTPTPSYPLILDKDLVPEELEWEAYVSDSESEGERRGSWCDMLSPEERERQKREREESRRVLSELKAVLGFRASEGERMKWKQLLFNDQAAVKPLGKDSSDPQTPSEPLDTPASEGVTGTGAEDGKHLSESPITQGNEREEDEGRARADLSPTETESDAEPVTEFCCGLEEVRDEAGALLTDCEGRAELYQYDGLSEQGAEQNGLDCLLKLRIPAVSVMDRLTELHGSEALSFSSSLAAQVVARSHSLANMEEQTFGDDGDDEEEADEEESDSRQNPEN